MCDLCDEASDGSVRRAGEFTYDFENEGTDFTDINLPRKFRSLKEHVILHPKTKSCIKAKKDQLEKDDNLKSEEL